MRDPRTMGEQMQGWGVRCSMRDDGMAPLGIAALFFATQPFGAWGMGMWGAAWALGAFRANRAHPVDKASRARHLGKGVALLMVAMAPMILGCAVAKALADAGLGARIESCGRSDGFPCAPRAAWEAWRSATGRAHGSVVHARVGVEERAMVILEIGAVAALCAWARRRAGFLDQQDAAMYFAAARAYGWQGRWPSSQMVAEKERAALRRSLSAGKASMGARSKRL